MPLIKLKENKASVIENAWVHAPLGEALPETGALTVCVARLSVERDALLARNAPLGVRLSPEDDPHQLEGVLERLELVEITFPKYTDGRGYSQAQLLRRRLDFKGEVRALGQVLRDQLSYMARSGIDAFEFEATSGRSEDVLAEAAVDFTQAYQRAAEQAEPIFVRRHKAAVKAVG